MVASCFSDLLCIFMWGVFDTDEHIHVAPTNEDCTIKSPHILDDMCFCDPEISQASGRLIIVHRDEQ